MARRKRAYMDDELSDSSNGSDSGDERIDGEDPDERAERELLDPYSRKRRRKDGDDDDEDDEEYGFGGGHRGGLGAKKRTNPAKLPSFVSGAASKLNVEDDQDRADESSSDESGMSEEQPADEDGEDEPQGTDAEDSDDEADEEEPNTRFSAMAAAARAFGAATTSSVDENQPTPARGGIGNRGGIGSTSRGGIGSYTSNALPAAFGSTEKDAQRPQRSFVRSNEPQKPKPAGLSAEEAVHFSKLQGSFGARMMAKMGWEVGSGLGPNQEGIVTPIESKLRPQRAGIAAGGFRERTKQSLAEAKRRGEKISDDDEEVKVRRGKKKDKAAENTQEARQQWKKPPKKRTVIQHRTYEEIMEESAQDAQNNGVGMIIDATGATPREVSSISAASASPWGATNDPTRLPELRHNLRLIVDLAKGELDGLAREAKALQERRKWVQDEDLKLRKAVADEAELIQRLQKVHIAVDDLNAKAKEATSSSQATLDTFTPLVLTLVQDYPNEYEKYRLDQIIIAAIAPVIRRLLPQWQPLEDPHFLSDTLRLWRKGLRMSAVPSTDTQVDAYGSSRAPLAPKQEELIMTPYESLLWSFWLPKLRSCVNNEWSAEQPEPMINVLESWADILPRFIWDNVLDQLILPKVQKAVAEWNPKRSKGTLHSLIFPWLPHVGARLDQVVEDARRKVKSLFRSWSTDQGIPDELMMWEKVFDVAEWENMLLKYVVPKLGSTLRNDLKINPRKQDMQPLEQVLQWSQYLRPSIIAQLLEAEFFPKWLNILHVWLIQPSANLEEVMQWYSFWKSAIPEDIYAMPRVTHGFTTGLQLMNNAMDLGADAPRLLKRPDFKPLTDGAPSSETKKTRPQLGPGVADITFRSLVEDYAAQHNLLFIPTGQSHERSRMPLYKVSPNVDGKGGITVYLLDDAVWSSVEGSADWRAIGLEDVVLRATKARK